MKQEAIANQSPCHGITRPSHRQQNPPLSSVVDVEIQILICIDAATAPRIMTGLVHANARRSNPPETIGVGVFYNITPYLQ